MIDLGREPIPVAAARRELAGVTTLECVWSGEGDYGLEVGLVSAGARLSASAMRRAWEARRGGRAVPLVLVQPFEGGLRICGPAGPPAAVRDLPDDVAVTILRRALQMTPDVVVEALRAELARGIGSGGVPGVRNNGLVSTHYLLEKLPSDRSRWSSLNATGAPALRAEGRDIFAALGYEITASGDGELVLRTGGAPVALVHSYRAAHLLDRFVDEVGTPASAYALARARANGAPYAMLVAGTVARLLSRRSSTELGESAPSAAFLEIATDLLPPDRAGVIGACYAPEALRENGEFERVRAASERYAVGLRGRFRDRVYRDVVPALVRGIAQAADIANVRVDGEALYHATMLALFRTLFVLYAEDRDLLPVGGVQYRPHSLTERIDGVRRAQEGRGFDVRATDVWDDVKRIFRAVADGHQEWGVPAYDGGLFVDDANMSPEGALLAKLRLTNAHFGPALYGLAIDDDPEGGRGKVDFGDLGVRHIGNLYEGLLSYEVAIAEEDLAVDESEPDQPYVPARKGQNVEVRRGEPYMRSPKGGRKASGSYYTPAFVVDRLVAESVVPALDRHLGSLRDLGADAAAERLWDFRVCDPAMGSGHFLVSVVDAIAEGIAQDLYERPLPAVSAELERARTAVQKASDAIGAAEVAEVKDVDVLRRLVLKRCVYGVDLNSMAVELAQLSLWLHAFVPGLPLFYLGHTLRRGNSLVGTVGHEFESLVEAKRGRALFGSRFREQLEEALVPARDIALSPDLELHEVERSRGRQADLERITRPFRPYFDAYAADPLDAGDTRERILHGEIEFLAQHVDRETRALLERASAICRGFDALHWSLAFPEVFLRDRPGFDAVVANPPWEEVTVEELGFYVRYIPGLKSERSGEKQRARIREFARRHPEVERAYEEAKRQAEVMRLYLRGTYTLTRAGDPDLYKAFAERFLRVCRDGGAIGVVLPRTAFGGQGSEPFREALFQNAGSVRLDFLLNRGGWIFEDAEPRYTIALVAAEKRGGIAADLSAAGPADRPEAFATLDSRRVDWSAKDLRAADYYVPLVPEPSWADLFRHCYAVAPRFDADLGDWRAVPWSELHATNDRKSGLLKESGSGWPVYSGDSFDLWTPEHERPPFVLAPKRGLEEIQRKRLRSSVWRGEYPAKVLEDPRTLPQHRVRLLFRDVTRATDSRTVRACLVPPRVFAVNKAPSLLFPRGGERAQAYVLGVLCSLPFDWLARRRVETNLNFFILNALPFPRPRPEDPLRRRIAALAARLACVDERYADFAGAAGVEYGTLDDDARADQIAEIDALVAQLYRLTAEQLEMVFADFPSTEAGASEERRARVRAHLKRLA